MNKLEEGHSVRRPAAVDAGLAVAVLRRGGVRVPRAADAAARRARRRVARRQRAAAAAARRQGTGSIYKQSPLISHSIFFYPLL